MTRTHRFALLAVAIVVVVLAVVLIPGSDDSSRNDTRAATSTMGSDDTTGATDASGGVTAPDDSTTAETTPKTVAKAEPQARLPLLKAGAVRDIEVSKGDTVKFRATNPTAEEVHVHGYDIAKDIPAGQTITMSFEANIEGIFEIELEHAGEQIAKLTVNP